MTAMARAEAQIGHGRPGRFVGWPLLVGWRRASPPNFAADEPNDQPDQREDAANQSAANAGADHVAPKAARRPAEAGEQWKGGVQ